MNAKSLIIISVLAVVSLRSFGQAHVANGDFENWETKDLYVEFPPFESITNLIAAFNGEPNVTPVPGCDGGKGVRLETVDMKGDTIAAFLTIGELAPLSPGLPFTGEPDSMRICLRHDIQPGDTGMILIAFFAAGGLAGQIQPNSIVGTQTNWTSMTVDLPAFIQTPDSFSLVISSSWFDETPPIPGSWLEIDSIYMVGSLDQFPNFDFETCDTVQYEDPVDWFTTNRFLVLFGEDTLSVTRSSDSYSGNYAMRLESVSFNTGSDEDTVAFMTNGQDVGEFGPIGGQPFTGMNIPTNISGFYKYQPVGNDTAVAYVIFSKYDAGGDSLVNMGQFGTVLPPTGSYQMFDIPITLVEMPDTFQLGFGSSDFTDSLTQATVGIGSVLWIDSLHFNIASDIELELGEKMQFTVFPNPTQEYVDFQFEPIQGNTYVVELSGINGQLLHRENIEDLKGQRVQKRWPLQAYKPGLYFLTLKNENGDLLASQNLMILR